MEYGLLEERVAPKPLGKKVYQYETTANSTLIVGGYEPSYMRTSLACFDTSECINGWNLTSNSLALSGGSQVICG